MSCLIMIRCCQGKFVRHLSQTAENRHVVCVHFGKGDVRTVIHPTDRSRGDKITPLLLCLETRLKARLGCNDRKDVSRQSLVALVRCRSVCQVETDSERISFR